MINKKSLEELQNKTLSFLQENTQITMISPGGVARAISDVINQTLSEMYDDFDTDLAMAFVSTSSGFFLDLIGKLFGISRFIPTKIDILREDKLIKFFVKGPGTLKQKLGSNQINSGTTVSNLDSSVIYSTVGNTPFSDIATEVFVSATSNNTGLDANVGSDVLTIHSLGLSSVGVTNIGPISVGNTFETDDEFRTRIAVIATASQSSNETAVRLAVLGAPGVADVKIIPFADGSGTLNIFVIPQGNRISTSVKRRLIANIGDTVAYGISFRVSEPDYIPISLTVQARFTPETLDGEKEFIIRTAERAVLDYIGNLRPGDEFIINQVRATVININPKLIDMTLTELCINKKLQILRNFRLEDDEVFIPDEDVRNPIQVRT